MNEDVLDRLYECFSIYQRQIKGYATCANRAEIGEWEKWKEIVFRKKKRKDETICPIFEICYDEESAKGKIEKPWVKDICLNCPYEKCVCEGEDEALLSG